MISCSPRGARMDRWKPPVELSKKEQLIMKRLNRVRALFGFLRTKRHLLFDDTFQEQLEGMYRQTEAGDPPRAGDALHGGLVTRLRGRLRCRGRGDGLDGSAMAAGLGLPRGGGALYAQGALQAFRERMVANGMDRVLLERTVALCVKVPDRRSRGDHRLPCRRGGTVRTRRDRSLRPGGLWRLSSSRELHASGQRQRT